ncbi:MAG TPA: hypothetical protein QF700_10115 [Prochlorococcus sp.]|nr:hypothetical protein [Prochlorococcus sp.]
MKKRLVELHRDIGHLFNSTPVLTIGLVIWLDRGVNPSGSDLFAGLIGFDRAALLHLPPFMF